MLCKKDAYCIPKEYVSTSVWAVSLGLPRSKRFAIINFLQDLSTSGFSLFFNRRVDFLDPELCDNVFRIEHFARAWVNKFGLGNAKFAE